MAFVSGAGAGVPPASNGDASGGGGGNAPSSFGGLSLQQFQEALLQQHLSQSASQQLREQQQQQAQLQQAQQQQQQRESLIQQLLASSLISGALQQPPQQQQQQAAAPSPSPMQPSSAATAAAVAALLQQQHQPQQQQQPQPATSNPLASLLQQLQSQLLVQQLLQGAAAAVSTPAPVPNPTPNPLALLSNPTLLLYQQLQQQQLQQQQQQQQQLAAAVAASNPLLQHFASALQQQQQAQQSTSAFTSTAASSSASVAAGNSVSDAHALLQQRMLMESLLGGGGASSAAASSLASGTAAGTAPSTASAPPRDPQPSAPVARAAGGLTNGAPLVRANSGLDQARAAQAAAAAARAAANAASANNSVDPESVQDHISRLISENEAIVEPAPMLLKRRNYNHRGSGQQTSIDNESNASGSARTSPGLRSLRAQTTRSQSLFELNLKPLCAGGGGGGGSLTTGQPLSRSGNYDSHMLPSSALSASSTAIPPPACAFCGLQFPNEAGLHAHEPRCSRRLAEESASAHGASGGNIAAAAALQLLQQQIAQQQQQQQPSAVPTGAGLISPRTAAGAGSVGTPSASSTPATCGGQSQMDTRHPLKRRLLASVAQMEESAAKQAKMDLAPRQADEGIVVLESGRVGGQPDVMAILQQQQQQQPIAAAAEPPGLNRRATIATITLDQPQQPQPAPTANRLNPEQLHQLLQRLSAAGLKRDDQLLAVVAAAASAQDPSASHTQQPQHQQPSVAQVLQQQLSSPVSATDASGSSSTNVTAGGAGNHQESLSLTQKLQLLHQPPVQQQVPTSSQAGAFSGTSSAALTSRKTPDLPMREDVSISFQLRRQLAGLCSRPYYLTYPLTECHRDAANRAGYKELQPVVDEPPVSPPYPHEQRNGGRPVRDSLYTTAICTRTLPGAAVQSPLMESVYQVYKPHQGDEAESRLNMLFMSSVAVKPRVGEKTFYKYSMACKEGWQQRMTHSSFWEMSVKQRLCQRREQAEQEQQQEQQDQQLQETAAKSEAAAEDVKMDVVSTNENLLPLQPVGSKAMKTEERASSSLATEEKPLKEHIRAMVDGKRKAIDAKIEPPVNTLEEKKAAAAAARALAEELEKEMAAEMPDEMSKMVKYQNKCEPVIGGFRTDEVYVYVRGRGRGRYVCERCGIRCKKPSMLKKHIKSHTDIRPFQCKECNFSFKTKGNLTKHLASKAHRRKTTRVSGGEETMEMSDDEEEGRLQIAVDDDAANQGGNSPSAQEQQLNDDMSASDDEDFFPEDGLGRHPYHKFGQENILCERGAHTPPSRWMLVDDEPEGQRWPDVNQHNDSRPSRLQINSIRRCLSAPPAAQLSPASPSPKEYNGFTGASSSTMTSPVIGEGGSNGFVVSGTSIASSRMDSVVTAVSMGYVAIDGGNAFRTSAADLMARSGRGLSPTTMQFGNGSGSGNSTAVSAAAAPSPYVMEKEELPCGQCPRVFRKASELALHQHTHNLEQRMGAKHRSTFACPECKLTHKTRMQLIKHMEAAHAGSPSMPAGPILQLANAGGAEALGHILDGVDMSSSAAAHLTGIPPSNNPRSFMCSDCNIGFRKHGILAKHLRSKTHVMKLESQKLLPEDSLTLITKKDNGACLSEVDTTNCETARASILRIVDRIRTETAPLGSVPAATVPLGGGGNGMGPGKAFLDSVATSPVASSSFSIIGIAANNNFLRQQPSATQNMQQPQPSAAADGSERRGSFSMRRPSTSLTTPPFADSLQQQRETMLKQLDALRARTAPLETAAPTSAPEPSPAQVVTPPALGIFPSSSNANGVTASATIWMPPKAEEVTATVASTSLAGIFQGTDGIPATLNGMPDLERILRHLQQQRQQNQSQPHPSLNGSAGNGGHSHFSSATPPPFTASSAAALIGVPIPLTQTRCGICETQFESAIEYQVHMLTEHIVVRDGHHLRCPRPHCDKVYPNRESLRTHVVAHFMRASGATPDGIREDGDSLLANGSGIPGAGGLLVDPRLGAAAKDSSPLSEATGSVEGGSSCQSPASTDGLRICDEESPAASASATPATAESSSSSGFRSRTTSSTAKPVKPLPCSLCSARFSDAMQLQAHWLSHVSKRPHVCEVCDAGFTSAEMLVAHSTSAHGQSSGRAPKGGPSTAPSTTQQSTHSQPTFF